MESNVSRTVLSAEQPQLLAKARPFESDEEPTRLPDPPSIHGGLRPLRHPRHRLRRALRRPSLRCLFRPAARLDAEWRALRDANQRPTAQVPHVLVWPGAGGR
jgi:hypothetical protein